MSFRDELQNVSTKELMRMRKIAFQNGGNYDLDPWPFRRNKNVYTLEQLNEILFDREHIPNKKEAKELRRKASKAGNRQTRGAR